MRIALITNFQSRGLVKDADIIASCLAGHEVLRWQWTEPQDQKVDLAIHLEVIGTKVLANTKQNWLVPNLEFLNDSDLSIATSTSIDLLLCKTSSAHEFLSQLAPEKTQYIGFSSHDTYRPGIRRIEAFIHVAGKSQHRNTQAVLDAWKTQKLPYPLIVVAKYFKEDIPNVTLLDDVDEDVLIHFMNKCKYHILPSEYEGWGHALHEAQLVGAQILTTETESHDGQYLLPGISRRRQGQAYLHRVSAGDVADMVKNMMKHPMPSLRPRALKENREFQKRMRKLLCESL